MFKKLRGKLQRRPHQREDSRVEYSKSRVEHSKQDAIKALPFEVWDIIFTKVDLHDRASLALTCHHMHDMVGPEVWAELKTNDRERYMFLLTAQDQHYPAHHLCWHCAKFHAGAAEVRQRFSSSQSSDWANPTRSLVAAHPCPEQVKNPEAYKFPPELVLFDGTQGTVPWWVVQQIMRAHRHGSKYGLSAGMLNRTDKKSTGRIAACVNGSRARIVEGKLLVRTSTVGSIDSRAEKPNFDDIIRNVHTCTHYYRAPALNKICNAALLDMRDPDSKSPKGCGISPTYRCSSCPTEIRVSIMRAAAHELSAARYTYGGNAPGHVAVVERWQDLGRGLEPDDLEWLGLTTIRGLYMKRGREKIRAIRARFEDGARDEEVLPIGFGDGNGPRRKGLGDNGCD